MMTSVAGELYSVAYGRTAALRVSTVYPASDVYAALVRRGARPVVAEAMIVGLIKIRSEKC
jgi:hypothetical protein